jgi:hypothetical protein
VYRSILCIMRGTIATQDGFVKLHYTFKPAISKPYQDKFNKRNIKLTTTEINTILVYQIGNMLNDRIRRSPNKYMNSCTNRGGSFVVTTPIITDDVGCQFDIMEQYRSTDDTLPAYQIFANKHNGIYPDFTRWK